MFVDSLFSGLLIAGKNMLRLYRFANDAVWFNMNLFWTGSMTSLIIRDLQSNTKYYFKLQAATKAGLSPPTNTIQVYTHDLSKPSFSLVYLVFSHSTCWLLNFLSNCFNFEENFFHMEYWGIHTSGLSGSNPSCSSIIWEQLWVCDWCCVSCYTACVFEFLSLYCRVWMNNVKCIPWLVPGYHALPWQYHSYPGNTILTLAIPYHAYPGSIILTLAIPFLPWQYHTMLTLAVPFLPWQYHSYPGNTIPCLPWQYHSYPGLYHSYPGNTIPCLPWQYHSYPGSTILTLAIPYRDYPGSTILTLAVPFLPWQYHTMLTLEVPFLPWRYHSYPGSTILTLAVPYHAYPGSTILTLAVPYHAYPGSAMLTLAIPFLPWQYHTILTLAIPFLPYNNNNKTVGLTCKYLQPGRRFRCNGKGAAYKPKADKNSSVFKRFLKIPTEAARRVFNAILFQISGAECLKAARRSDCQSFCFIQ